MDTTHLQAISADALDRHDLWSQFLAELKPEVVAEVGVWKGEFAARTLRDNPSIERYYMIDPWAQLPEWNKPFNVDDDQFADVYEEAMAVTEFAGERRVVLRDRTIEAMSSIADDSLDFAYVDGDHTLRGIAIDLIRIWHKIKPGGYLGGDDMVASIWQHGRAFEPTLIHPFVSYFAEAYQAPIYLMRHEQFLIRKPLPGEPYEWNDFTGRYGERSLLRQLQG